MENVWKRLNQIADEIDVIRRDLPHDSVSAFHYKHCLGKISNTLESEGKKAYKIANAIDKAIIKYSRGDQKVSAIF